MGQQLREWQSASSQRLWLSLLIDTAEEISRPQRRAVPCDRQVIRRPACAACPSGVVSHSLRVALQPAELRDRFRRSAILRPTATAAVSPAERLGHAGLAWGVGPPGLSGCQTHHCDARYTSSASGRVA